MASLAEIYDWFMTGKKPTQAQFWASWGSFWNKNESIPQSAVSGLTSVLNAKVENDQFNAHKTANDAHQALFNLKQDLDDKGQANGYVPLNEFVKIAYQYLSIVNDLETGGSTALASAETVKTLKGQIDAINLILTSDDVNLDTVQELVDAIKEVETSLQTILVNDLTTGGTTKALTAEMGKQLDLIKESTANKSTSFVVDYLSDIKFPSVKAVYDFCMSAFKKKFLDFGDVSGIAHTFGVGSENTMYKFSNNNPITATIPTNATTPFEIGTVFETIAIGNGALTVTGAPGVTILSNLSNTSVKNGVRRYTKIDTDTWTVEGVEVTLTSAQTFSSGIKTFLNGVFGLRNVANTFTSFFTNSATASRTWTFPDKNGTVAMTSDLPTNTVATGNQNRMLKYINAGGTQAGNSRIEDTGTYVGIDTVNPPTKDITLGSQSNKNIGVEDSDLLTNGRDLILGAGRTVNFAFNNAFNRTTSPAAAYGMCSTPSGNMYIVGGDANVYKQTGGSGIWDIISTGIVTVSLRAICCDVNNNLYVAVNNGSIYKQTNEAGNWVNLNQTARQWVGMCVASGDVYASVNNGDIYKQTGGVGDFIALNQITRAWGRMTVSASGLDVYIISSGVIYKQINKTGNFVYHANAGQGGLVIDSSNNLYVQNGVDIVVQNNLTGAFVSTGSNILEGSGSVWGMAQHINGVIYAGIWGGLMYIKSPSGTGVPNLDGGTYKAKAGTGKGTGKSRVEFYTGQKTVSGTDMQVETLREYIDENGYHIYTSMPVYADNAAAIAGGLPVGCEYRTPTGVKMIVY